MAERGDQGWADDLNPRGDGDTLLGTEPVPQAQGRKRVLPLSAALLLSAAAALALLTIGHRRVHETILNLGGVVRLHVLPPALELGVKKPPPARRGSFLVIGDWGYDHAFHGNLESSGCQREVANEMLAKMRQLGDVRFVINVGDSFYPGGVESKADTQWDTKWRDIYDRELRSVPWYSVYGNHDYFFDPCACSTDARGCSQLNSDEHDLNYFYMPNYTWFKLHPELDLEVIALDMNQYSGFNWVKDMPIWCLGHPQPWLGQRPCHHRCFGNLAARTEASLRLFEERAAVSSAKTLLVFSHYPTDYFAGLQPFMAALRNQSMHRVEYFGGHRHNVDDSSTVPTAPNHNWLSGGGGGWSIDGGRQGFVVGEIGPDASLITYPVFVDQAECR